MKEYLHSPVAQLLADIYFTVTMQLERKAAMKVAVDVCKFYISGDVTKNKATFFISSALKEAKLKSIKTRNELIKLYDPFIEEAGILLRLGYKLDSQEQIKALRQHSKDLLKQFSGGEK